MSSEYEGTVTKLLVELKAGNHDALLKLWNTYFDRLKAVARECLTNKVKRVGDEEDVLMSVFIRLWGKELHRNGFRDLHNSGQLWARLAQIAQSKAIDHTRRESRNKRGGDKTIESLVEELVGREPTPDVVASMNEELERLLNRLGDDTLRIIVTLSLAGDTPNEIADAIGLSERSVQRKLKIICAEWEKEIGLS